MENNEFPSKNKICYIVGAGDFFEGNILLHPGDMLIAADGGYEHLKSVGLTPDLVIGDFDSSKRPDSPGVPIIEAPAEKDDSDTLLAIKHGFSLGFSDFEIYGGMGGRLDHTLANLAALCWVAGRGGRARLVGRDQVAAAIAGGQSLRFGGDERGYISVFCWGGDARGVTVRGLKYPLENAVLTAEFPLGLSNEFLPGRGAEISVGKGCLVVVWSSDHSQFSILNSQLL